MVLAVVLVVVLVDGGEFSSLTLLCHAQVSGCNRITCACGKSFCWKCGKFSADSARKVYDHLNKVCCEGFGARHAWRSASPLVLVCNAGARRLQLMPRAGNGCISAGVGPSLLGRQRCPETGVRKLRTNKHKNTFQCGAPVARAH